MFRPGTVGEADYSPPPPGVHTLSSISQQIPPTGKIQRIFQEGSKSKNTYVIIVNNDNVSQKSADEEKRKSLLSSQEADGTEMTETLCNQEVRAEKNKLLHEDIKLNLRNICDDDEYDSGLSSSNVFLKPEMVEAMDIEASHEDDSAIVADLSDVTERSSRHHISTSKQKVNTYVIQSPVTSQQKHFAGSQQHSFPVISQPFVGSKSHLKSKLAYTTPGPVTSSSSSSKQSSHPTARKIFLVTPTSQNSGSNLKKSVAYTNEAVPTVNSRSKYQTVQSPVTVVPRPNPKAVPTASNISPIQNLTNRNLDGHSFTSGNSFTPVPVSSSPGFGALGKGPLTSTPILNEVPRISHLKQEAASQHQRPYYIISSPFATSNANSQNAANSSYSSSSFNTPQTKQYRNGSPVLCDTPPNFNESSGYVSNSGSLEFSNTPGSLGSSLECSSPVTCEEKKIPETIQAGKTSADIDQDKIVVHIENIDMKDEASEKHDLESEESVASSQESVENLEKECLNRSLTNIQWLKGTGMEMKEEKSDSHSRPVASASQNHNQPINWRSLSSADIKKISDDCGREKRPPFSYMTMITMALYSRADRKMMLKEICKWIEDTFPYYKYTAKPGWKNSIRHNLSLYNIFVREPVRRHGSYWTIKPDCEPKTKQYKDRSQHQEKSSVHHSTPSLSSHTPGMIPIIPMYSSMGALSAITPQSFPVQAGSGDKKKGLMPILPRPSPLGSAPQAYALIPIQNVNQPFSVSSQAQQPVIVQMRSSTGSACPSPGISEVSAAVASIQVSSASPVPSDFTDNSGFPGEGGPVNIVKQAWLDSQNLDTASSVDSDIASSSEFGGVMSNRLKSKRPRGKPELPKPTFYKKDTAPKKSKSHSKRRKLVQKERKLDDSSDEEDDDVAQFLSNLQPPKNIGTIESVEGILITSTPVKTDNSPSAQLPSPIHGFTPLRTGNLFDGSFLETLNPDGKVLGFSPDLDNVAKISPDTSPKPTKLPNTSLLDSLMLPTLNTPEKDDGSPGSNTSLSNHNLSRFLSEYGLDPNMVDTGENFTDLNWSAIQQIVDNMDTG